MAANPVPLSHGLADQFDAMRWPTAFLKADVDVGRKSEHVLGLSQESREAFERRDSFGVGKLAIRRINRRPATRSHRLQWQQRRKPIDVSRHGRIAC